MFRLIFGEINIAAILELRKNLPFSKCAVHIFVVPQKQWVEKSVALGERFLLKSQAESFSPKI